MMEIDGQSHPRVDVTISTLSANIDWQLTAVHQQDLLHKVQVLTASVYEF